MFGELRKKLSAFLKKPVFKKKEEKKKPSKTLKKKKSKKNVKETLVKAPIKDKQVKDEDIKEIEALEDLKEEIKDEVEEIKETPKEEPVEEKPSFFSKLKTALTTSTLSQEKFNEIFEDFELILLENNVALEVVDKIREELSKDLVNISIKKHEIENTIIQSLKDSILKVLIEPPNLIEEIKKSQEPYVILFFGINGSGKTTSIAKLSHLLNKNKISCVLAAADTFRAASIEQLQKHADKLNVPIVKHDYGSDPASVAFDAISYAKKNKIKAVLIDTAGRMYTKTNLMKEMEKIVKVSNPNLKIFVAESITGNDALSQAKTFNESVGIDGIILTKADIDEKAGTILSVSLVTAKPIYFLGVGQEYSDLQVFTKETVLKNLGLEN